MASSKKSSIRDQCKKLLKENVREHNGHVYTIPSPTTYPHQWLWDSCFHSIMNCYFNISVAKKEIESLFTYQWNNGKIPL